MKKVYILLHVPNTFTMLLLGIRNITELDQYPTGPFTSLLDRNPSHDVPDKPIVFANLLILQL